MKGLLLNPRLPSEVRERFLRVWHDKVEPRFPDSLSLATSGTSGDAFGRLIVVTREALLASAEAVNSHLDSNSRDVWMKTLPEFHVGGLGILYRAKLSGARVMESRLPQWNAREFSEELASSRATLLSLVPTQVFDLISLRIPAPSELRAVVVGGARLDSSLYDRALELGWPLLPSYGMTECCSQVATARDPRDPRLFPLRHVEVRIGEAGRIEIKSPSLLTARVSFGATGESVEIFAPDSWFTTEDRGELLERGELVVHGRDSDFVKIGGEGVLLARLESLLESLKLDSSFNGDAALIAAPDARLGAVLVLFSSAAPETTNELVARFNAMVAPFERIRSVRFMTSLPRTPLGKLQRARAIEAVEINQ